jgi:hypothetical protein
MLVMHVYDSPATQETEGGGPQSKANLGKTERPYLKTERKTKGLGA